MISTFSSELRHKLTYDPVSFKSDPLNIKSDPVSFKSDPVSFKSDPLSIKSDPVSFKSDPVSFKSNPVSFKSFLSPVSTLLSTTPYTLSPPFVYCNEGVFILFINKVLELYPLHQQPEWSGELLPRHFPGPRLSRPARTPSPSPRRT